MTLQMLIWFISTFVILSHFNPKTTSKFKSRYDYIIVGAGSAGSVVASRLSEDSCVNVLLLEAGPDADRLTEIPAMTIISQEGNNTWGHVTVPQKRGALMLKDKRIPVARGKGLGGSSLINGMLYTRGNKRDYDTWAEQGADGWSWNDVLPYFLKSENNTDPEIISNGYHNDKGYLTVQSSQYSSKLMTAFANAASERGYEYLDVNGAKQTGYFKLQGTIRNGRRCNVAKAFLIPAQDRPNLDIVKNALVTKILINRHKVACGVQFEIGDKHNKVYANKEVIISSGAINSPQLLMLSGIGPKKHLRKHRIKVIKDLPVGNNFQDHVGMASLSFETTKEEDLAKRLASHLEESVSEYNMYGTGLLTSLSGIEGEAFINSKFNDPSLDWPDVQIDMFAASAAGSFGSAIKDSLGITDEVYKQVYEPYEGKNTSTLYPSIMRPKSRGTIRLASTNPKDHPLIDPNLFEIEEDLEILVDVLKECVNIVTKTEAFKEMGAKMFQTKFPGCEKYTLYSEEYLRCLGRMYTLTAYHAAGTCKMGRCTDKTAVVDTKLRVIGVKKLRVVDGSIMPNLVTANTNAPIIMIAEKASDMIKADNPQRLHC